MTVVTDQSRNETHGAYVRHDGLVRAVANWRMVQEGRKAEQLRVLAHLRALGVVAKGDKTNLDDLPELCVIAGVPEWLLTLVMFLRDVEKGWSDDDGRHPGAVHDILREWRTHPLAPWAESFRGLGAHSAAIIVGLLDGDPYIAYPKRRVGERGNSRLVEGEPYERTVSQLWSYCRLNPERRPHEGMSQDDLLALGKSLLKSRLFLASEAMLKAGNRGWYDERKAATEGRTHERPCPQCKGSSKVGEPWRDGHRNADAHRIVSKRLLVAMYDEAKRLHQAGEWR